MVDRAEEMLILKAFINERQIDEIYIQNIRVVVPEYPDLLCEYKITKPEGDYPAIFHRRDEGWKPLAWSALGRLIKKEKGRKLSGDE